MQGDVMYRFRGFNPFFLYINKNGPSIFLKKNFPVLSGHDFS